MVDNCASSRGHTGLTGGAPCDGGGPGFTCAWASRLSAKLPNRAAQARIDLARGEINFSGISGQLGTKPRGEPKARPAASHSRFSGQRHVVSGAPVWQGKPLFLPRQAGFGVGGKGDFIFY